MNLSKLGQRSLLISYFLFVFVVCASVYFLDRLDANKGDLSFIPISVLLAVTLSCQAFTIHHHKKKVSPYVFATLYAIAFFAALISMLS